MVKEEALLLGPQRSLVGIYTSAASSSSRHGADIVAVLLNAGLIHHVGPHRLHVNLSRALAARGISSLRIDLSGIGDSSVRPDGLPAQELAVREPREIMDQLVRRGHQNFALFGICSGARQALQAAVGDPRVKGLVLVNPASLVDDPELASRAATQYYLRRSLWSPRAWINLFTGRVKYQGLFRAIAGMVRRLGRGVDHAPDKPGLADMARQRFEPLLAQGTRLLMVLSDRDAQFIKLLDGGVRDLQSDGQPQIEMHPKADHLFTSLKEKEALVEQVCDWMESLQRASSETGSAVSRRVLPAD